MILFEHIQFVLAIFGIDDAVMIGIILAASAAVTAGGGAIAANQAAQAQKGAYGRQAAAAKKAQDAQDQANRLAQSQQIAAQNLLAKDTSKAIIAASDSSNIDLDNLRRKLTLRASRNDLTVDPSTGLSIGDNPGDVGLGLRIPS